MDTSVLFSELKSKY